MRETKDQKIARLERKVNELYQLLKSKKSEHKETDSDFKKRIAQLQQQIKETKIQHKQEIAKMQAEIQQLNENISKAEESNQLLRTHIRMKEKEIKELQGQPEEIFSDDWLEITRRDDESRLESFGWGVPTDKWGTPFIAPENLILNINPNTGNRLCYMDVFPILELIKNEKFYIDALESIKDYQQAARKGDLDALEIIHKKGMEVYHKLYPDYFSKQ